MGINTKFPPGGVDLGMSAAPIGKTKRKAGKETVVLLKVTRLHVAGDPGINRDVKDRDRHHGQFDSIDILSGKPLAQKLASKIKSDDLTRTPVQNGLVQIVIIPVALEIAKEPHIGFHGNMGLRKTGCQTKITANRQLALRLFIFPHLTQDGGI